MKPGDSSRYGPLTKTGQKTRAGKENQQAILTNSNPMTTKRNQFVHQR
jgi:hypothetical protein